MNKNNNAIIFYLIIMMLGSFRLIKAQQYDKSYSFEQFSHIFAQITQDSAPAVVKVSAVQWIDEFPNMPKKRVSNGSGWVISPEGHILTCAHVIEGGAFISVFLENQQMNAALVHLDQEIDIAVLKIDGMNLPYLRMGDSDLLRVGEWVISMGHPFSFSTQPFVARGIIGMKEDKSLYLDILTYPASSGGPLLNLKGEVIGMMNAFFQFKKIRGPGTAIPINLVKKHMPDL